MKSSRPRSPYDTMGFLFLAAHAQWLLDVMGIAGRVDNDRRLFSSDFSRTGFRRLCTTGFSSMFSVF